MEQSNSYIPEVVQVNHDLNLLYAIARTQLPKEILEGLLYGNEFEEPKELDLVWLKDIIRTNTKHEWVEVNCDR